VTLAPDALLGELNVPQVFPEQLEPDALQVTPLLEASLMTVAISVLSVCPTVNPPRFGDTLTPMLEEPGTVSVVEPITLPNVAEIAVVPEAMAVARPPDVIVAVAVLEEAQVTLLVRFCVLLSE
jgi:hypothetical protein